MKSVIYVNNLQAWMKIYPHSCFKVMKLHITAVYIYSVLQTSCNFPLCLQLEKSKANKLNKNSFMTVHPSVYGVFFMPSWSTLDTRTRQPFCVYSAQAATLPVSSGRSRGGSFKSLSNLMSRLLPKTTIQFLENASRNSFLEFSSTINITLTSFRIPF